MPTETIGEFFLHQGWQFALLAALVVCSAGASAAETAMFSLSRADLYHLGHDPRRLARLAAQLMRDPGSVLATVLLANSVFNVLYFINSTLLVVKVERGVAGGEVWGPALAAGTLLLLILLGEVAPKAAAFVSGRQLAPLAALPLAAISGVVRPAQRVLAAVIVEPLTRLLAPARSRRGGLSAEELDALLSLSQKRGLIGRDECQLLQQVLELTDLRAGDIMVPRVDMVAYPAGGDSAGLLALLRRKRVTKVMAYEGDLDHIVGVLDVKRLLAEPESPFRQILEPVQFVPETASLERVLLQFRATGTQIAVVVDEYGGTAGLITLAEVLGQIVGGLTDAQAGARAPAVQQAGPGEWLVDGDLPVHEWAEAFPIDLRGARFTTVGGFVVSLLGRIPHVGETAEYRNVAFTVEAMRQQRVALLRVRLKEARP